MAEQEPHMKIYIRTIRYASLGLLTVFAVFSCAHTALAATLSVSAAPVPVTVGDVVTVKVVVNAGGQAINTTEGTLQFPSDILDVVSIDKSSSIFSIWVEEPSFSNQAGTVSFSGGLPSPGFNGANGTVVKVVFHAKRSGTATLSLSGATVRANDGLGTNVLQTTNGTVITVVAVTSVPIPAPTPVAPTSAPTVPSSGSAITILSDTNPSQDQWYSNTVAGFTLKVPGEADALRTSLSTNANTTPHVTYRPPITQKTVDALTDGVWYFSAQGHYVDGWGPITSYRLQIDATPPVFSALSAFYDATSTALSVFASASDATSGIRNYALLVDNATSATFNPADVANGSYRVPIVLNAGVHTVQIRVFDNAGNETDSKEFTITAPASAENQNPIVGWFTSFSSNDWILFIALLFALFSVAMNIILWMRLRFHERRLARRIDTHRIRSLTVDQLTVFKKEVTSEIRILERIHQRRDITIEEGDEIKQMHGRLLELETFIGKQIEVIEKQ
jgi:hypothetical protein